MIRVVVLAHSLALRAGLRALISEDEEVEVILDLASIADMDMDAISSSIPANTDVIVAEPIAFGLYIRGYGQRIRFVIVVRLTALCFVPFRSHRK